MKNYIWLIATATVLAVMLGVALVGELPLGDGSAQPATTPTPSAIGISMASSITKYEWLDEATVTFNVASKIDPDLQVDGRPVEVEILKEKDPLSGV